MIKYLIILSLIIASCAAQKFSTIQARIDKPNTWYQEMSLPARTCNKLGENFSGRYGTESFTVYCKNGVLDHANETSEPPKYLFDSKPWVETSEPAVIWEDGTKEWWKFGRLNRHGQPAVIWPDGSKEWWRNGNLFRLDGPSIEYTNGTKIWHNEEHYTGFQGKIMHPIIRVEPRTILRGPSGKCHAVEPYCVKGLRHRTDGPAVTWDNGMKWWFINGEPHRDDGPAVEWADGSKWWLNHGLMHRDDGPAIEWAEGTKFWMKNAGSHRTDGPAIEFANGDKEWWVNDKRHRTDGPAVERANGDKEWWVNGVQKR